MSFGSIIYLEKEKKYRAFYSYAGKRISKRFLNERDAENWLASCKAELAHGTFVAPSNLTLGQWVLDYLNTYAKPKCKYKTYQRYLSTAKQLDELEYVPLQKLTALAVQKFINTFPTASKRHKVYDFLNRIIRKAAALRLVPYDIMAAVDAPQYAPEKKPVFTDKEMDRIKAVLPNTKYYAFFMVAIATGCRIGEICGLRGNDIHDGYIRIEREVERKKGGFYEDAPKSKSGIRDIPLPRGIIRLLKEEYTKEPLYLNGYVFRHEDGTPYLPDAFQRQWKKILSAAQVPYRNFHQIRHTHATNLLHKFDVVEVQHRLGHSQASTTLNMYGHAKPEYRQAIVDEVERLVK